MLTTNEAAELTTNQTVRLELGTKDGAPSMRIGFTDQHLLAHLSALEVWRRYNGRADIKNRIKELGAVRPEGLCCRSFWATEAIWPSAPITSASGTNAYSGKGDAPS